MEPLLWLLPPLLRLDKVMTDKGGTFGTEARSPSVRLATLPGTSPGDPQDAPRTGLPPCILPVSSPSPSVLGHEVSFLAALPLTCLCQVLNLKSQWPLSSPQPHLPPLTVCTPHARLPRIFLCSVLLPRPPAWAIPCCHLASALAPTSVPTVA